MTKPERHRDMKHLIFVDASSSTAPIKTLRIQGKSLRRISMDIFTYTDLEALDLRPEREACLNYCLQELPPEIGQLSNLRILLIDTNELHELPNEIGKLHNVEKLSLSNNMLRSLPSEFKFLTNLTSLHLSNNKIEQFPQQICELVNLEFLDMSDNYLSAIPDEIKRLSNLHTLMFFHNDLLELPDSITELSELHCLWLGDNKLKRLPRTFGNLNKLDWTTNRYMMSTVIDGNPLEEPPLTVCKQGIDAIAEYFGNTPISTPELSFENSDKLDENTNGNFNDMDRYEKCDSEKDIQIDDAVEIDLTNASKTEAPASESPTVKFKESEQADLPKTKTLNRPPTPYSTHAQNSSSNKCKPHKVNENHTQNGHISDPLEPSITGQTSQQAKNSEKQKSGDFDQSHGDENNTRKNADIYRHEPKVDYRATQRSPKYFTTAKDSVTHSSNHSSRNNAQANHSVVNNSLNGQVRQEREEWENDSRHKKTQNPSQRALKPVSISTREWLDIRAKNSNQNISAKSQ